MGTGFEVLQWVRIIVLMLISGYIGWWLNGRRYKCLRNRFVDLGTENTRLKEELAKIRNN